MPAATLQEAGAPVQLVVAQVAHVVAQPSSEDESALLHWLSQPGFLQAAEHALYWLWAVAAQDIAVAVQPARPAHAPPVVDVVRFEVVEPVCVVEPVSVVEPVDVLELAELLEPVGLAPPPPPA